MNVKTISHAIILACIAMAGQTLGQEPKKLESSASSAVEQEVKELKDKLVSSIRAQDLSQSRQLIDQIIEVTDVDLSASILDANTSSSDRKSAAIAASYAVEFKKLRKGFANLKTIDSGALKLIQRILMTTGLTGNEGGYDGGGYGGAGGEYGGDGGYGGGGYGGYGGGVGGGGGAAPATRISELEVLRKQLAHAPEKEQDKIGQAIRKLVTEEFENESQKRKKQLAKLEKRLDDLRNQLQRRSDSREDLIEIRVKTLLLEARGLMVEKHGQNAGEDEEEDDPFSDF